jgi:hypothetical protein
MRTTLVQSNNRNTNLDLMLSFRVTSMTDGDEARSNAWYETPLSFLVSSPDSYSITKLSGALAGEQGHSLSRVEIPASEGNECTSQKIYLSSSQNGQSPFPATTPNYINKIEVKQLTFISTGNDNIPHDSCLVYDHIRYNVMSIEQQQQQQQNGIVQNVLYRLCIDYTFLVRGFFFGTEN